MNKLRLLLPIALLLSQFSLAQGLVWAKRMGGTSLDEAHSIAVDKDGNVISTGRFQGTVDFDPGPLVFNLTAPTGNREGYIQKLNSNGDLVWAVRIGGQDNDFGVSVTTDLSGNIYTVGSFNDVVDFDPGPGTAIVENQSLAVFILKLDAAGNFVWVKTLTAHFFSPNTDYSFGDCIKLDQSGNIYITAGFIDIVDFDPGPDTYNLSAADPNFWDAFILKLNPAGEFLWATRLGADSYDSGMSIDVDQNGNVYSTGYFSHTADFDPGPDVFNLTSLGGNDIYVQKLDASGNFLWAKQLGELLYDEFGNGLAVDAAGNVYVTGNYNSYQMDFDPGPGVFKMSAPFNDNIFILKLNTAGDFVWAKQMGGEVGNERSRTIRVDHAGNIYNIGEFGQTADFDPGPDTVALTDFGQRDIYIQKLDSSGNHLWVKQMGGTQADRGSAIALDQNGDVYATGSFRGTADFDPNAPTFNLISAGMPDIFVCRLSQYWDFHGTVFKDKNGNGIREADEPGLPNVIIEARDKGLFATTISTGDYHIYNNVIGDTVRAIVPTRFWYWSVAPAFAVPNAPGDSAHFAITVPPGILDVAITSVEITRFRPGFQTEVIVQVDNYGSVPAASVWVVFDIVNLPSPLEYLSAVPAPTLVSGDSIVWFVDSLDVGETIKMRLQFRTLPTTPINSIISSWAKALLNNDLNLPNNFFASRSTVVGAVDPNDKQVMPEKLPIQELDSTDLRYVVRFQNTGNFPADFVVIRDTLPWELEASSLQIISASHPYTWRLFDERVLEVRFDPIFLPDSLSNEPASHGFVAFTVRPKSNLVIGNLISNWAAIYFDFNPPIITNYAVTKVTATSNVSEAGKKDWLEFGLTPNPVSRHSVVTVDLPQHITSTAEIRVFDVQGKLIQQTSAPAGNRQVPLNRLPSGTYWVQVRVGNLSGGKLLIVE